jgi:hypothetical protein
MTCYKKLSAGSIGRSHWLWKEVRIFWSLPHLHDIVCEYCGVTPTPTHAVRVLTSVKNYNFTTLNIIFFDSKNLLSGSLPSMIFSDWFNWVHSEFCHLWTAALWDIGTSVRRVVFLIVSNVNSLELLTMSDTTALKMPSPCSSIWLIACC